MVSMIEECIQKGKQREMSAAVSKVTARECFRVREEVYNKENNSSKKEKLPNYSDV